MRKIHLLHFHKKHILTLQKCYNKQTTFVKIIMLFLLQNYCYSFSWKSNLTGQKEMITISNYNQVFDRSSIFCKNSGRIEAKLLIAPFHELLERSRQNHDATFHVVSTPCTPHKHSDAFLRCSSRRRSWKDHPSCTMRRYE